MPRTLPDASLRHPIVLPDGTTHTGTVFLSRAIDHPRMEIGDYSYYSDFEPVTDWAARIAPYLYPGAAERLVIGRFCQFAHGTRFITASANHPMAGFSAYPFRVFDPETMDHYHDLALQWGDTVIGNDVWTGFGATVLPGVTIGDGAIVGARAVVAGDVPPFAVVAGNPARVVRMRFPPEVVARLQAIRWWDWPEARIAAHLEAIEGADIEALEAASR